MHPTFLAFLFVAALFATVYFTRTAPAGSRRMTRVAAAVLLVIGMAALSENADAAAQAGQRVVYFGLPALLAYFVLVR